MNERIIIRNFAGIKEMDVTLGPINVLIGPQATGKSICAKSLYYFKSFVGDLFDAIENGQTKRQFDSAFLQKFEDYFPSANLKKGAFLLRYEVADEFIQVEGGFNKPTLSYSNYYKKELATWRNNLKNAVEKLTGDKGSIDRYRITSEVRRAFSENQKQHLGEAATYSQIFIPAGRSFFAILQSNIFSFLLSNKAIDPFLAEFGSFYETIKFMGHRNLLRDDEDRKLKNKIDALVESIINGKHIIEDGRDFLVMSDGRKISLASSSSGQQEMLPLALMLSTISLTWARGVTGTAVYIEEPEAHLFPTAQRNIVDLIATVYNLSKRPVQFVITTHSPYILTAFNNLIHAGNTSIQLSSDDLQQLRKIIPEEQLLKSRDVKVYSLYNGTSELIMSEDTGLISTNILDAVSDDLATEFDNILNIV